MYSIINSDLGKFDMVTSFCTLYYLKEPQMEAVVKRASEISLLMVIQANTMAGSTWDSDKPRRASVEFLKNLLEKNGFPYVDIKSPPFSTRPLLIGVT
jgi:nicotinamide riboside kinase